MKTMNNEIKTKLGQLKWRAKGKVQEIKIWAQQNPEMAMLFVSSGIAVVSYVGKAAVKNATLNKQEAVKELYCYDRSLGHYWELRRKLTNKEWLEIDKRKRDGEKLADILDEMKVLK